jgi:hypothetical protein
MLNSRFVSEGIDGNKTNRKEGEQSFGLFAPDFVLLLFGVVMSETCRAASRR